MKWSYGITTVPERINTTFPKTLNSLMWGGFDKPHIFVDGECDPTRYDIFMGLDISCRYPRVSINGHWILSLGELYVRDPHADRYALFQDDFVTYKNVRTYLERIEYPPNGYLNLLTFPQNQKLCPRGFQGFYSSNQRGLGAVALVFSNEAIGVMLSSCYMFYKLKDKGPRGWRYIDGGIVETFKSAGWKEYVHSPSLVLHTGHRSTHAKGTYQSAESFLGEQFDAMELLK